MPLAYLVSSCSRSSTHSQLSSPFSHSITYYKAQSLGVYAVIARCLVQVIFSEPQRLFSFHLISLWFIHTTHLFLLHHHHLHFFPNPTLFFHHRHRSNLPTLSPVCIPFLIFILLSCFSLHVQFFLFFFACKWRKRLQ